MNASGEKWPVGIGGTDYYFDSVEIVCSSRIADTALVSGGVYRRRALPGIYEITLKARVPFDRLSALRQLIDASSAADVTITTGSESFTSCMMRRGGFSALPGKDEAEFCIIFSSEV